MADRTYNYTIKGTAAGGQTWETKGTLTCDFAYSFSKAMRLSFDQLTRGKAQYGKPGVGCAGPYDIQSVLIEQVSDG